MNNYRLKIYSNQAGASTLLMAGVLLFSTTLITLYGAQVSILEQRVTNNFYRAKQATMGSDAGLNKAITAIDKSQITTDSGTLDILTLSGVGAYTISYQTIVPDDPNKLQVTVTGQSLDDSATTKISQQFEFSPFIRKSFPAVTLTSLDNVLLTDNINIDNKDKDNDTVLWAGGTLTKSGNNVNVPRSPSQITDPNNRKERIVTSSEKLSLNADGSEKNDDAFFETFFSNTKENIRKVSTVINCNTSECTNNDIEGLSGLIWISGDLTMAYDKETGIYNKNAGIIDPIILVIDGDFKMSHKNANINGLVYIMGDWLNNNAKGKIKGSVIVEGNTVLTGTAGSNEFLELKYNQTIIDYLINNSGVYLPVPGSWRNFENS